MYRNTTGKLIYLSIDRRDLKYVAQEMAKLRELDMELLKPAGLDLAGRQRVGTLVGIADREGPLELYTDGG